MKFVKNLDTLSLHKTRSFRNIDSWIRIGSKQLQQYNFQSFHKVSLGITDIVSKRDGSNFIPALMSSKCQAILLSIRLLKVDMTRLP